MNLENLKRNKIKTLLQSISYQIYYATKIDNKNNKIFISDHDAKLRNTFGDILKLCLTMTRI